MLSKVQKIKFTTKVKNEIKKILGRLNIIELTNDTICNLQKELDSLVVSLVNAQEDGENIDEELLEIYDLLTDIVLDNEEDLDFLNQLFFN